MRWVFVIVTLIGAAMYGSLDTGMMLGFLALLFLFPYGLTLALVSDSFTPVGSSEEERIEHAFGRVLAGASASAYLLGAWAIIVLHYVVDRGIESGRYPAWVCYVAATVVFLTPLLGMKRENEDAKPVAHLAGLFGIIALVVFAVWPQFREPIYGWSIGWLLGYE